MPMADSSLDRRIIRPTVRLRFVVVVLMFNQLTQGFDFTQPTPKIGGSCKLGSQDFQIGGKQTQFFLRCEANSDSVSDEGIWVVKSRNTALTASQIPANAVVENSEKTVQQSSIKKTPTKMSPTADCDLDSGAQENAYCGGSRCLQAAPDQQNNLYLQCDPNTHRWRKRSCQEGFQFDVNRQSCVSLQSSAKGRTFRQFPGVLAPPQNPTAPGGLVCTYAQCSPMMPCAMGTCNNGYCCTAVPAASLGAPLLQAPTAYGQFPAAVPSPQQQNVTSTTTVNTTLTSVTTTAFAPPLLMDSVAADWFSYAAALQQQQQTATNEREGGGAMLKNEPRAMIRHHHSMPSGGVFEKGGGVCSSGFKSPLSCSNFFECPPGLTCDLSTRLCCPLPPSSGGGGGEGSKLLSFQKESFRKYGRFGKLKNAAERVSNKNDQDEERQPLSQHHFRRYNNQFGFNKNGGGGGDEDMINGFPSAKVRRTYQSTMSIAPGMQPQPLPPMTAAASPLYACPGGLPAFGQCIGGRCGPGYACSPPSNVCCAVPTAIPATVCPDGTQAAGACVNGQCGAGFTCNQGLCCSNSSQTPRCLDGSQAIGACIQGKCGTGYTCTTGHICCPSTLNVCPNGANSIGQCVNGACPTGYTCINNLCCPETIGQTSPTITCPQEDSNGPCIGDPGTCPEPGFMCDTGHNWCCPQTTGEPVGPCIKGEGGDRLCPDGYACKGEGEGQCYRLDVETCAPQHQNGRCSTDDDCPTDYKDCRATFCCLENSDSVPNARRRKRATSAFLRIVRAT